MSTENLNADPHNMNAEEPTKETDQAEAKDIASACWESVSPDEEETEREFGEESLMEAVGGAEPEVDDEGVRQVADVSGIDRLLQRHKNEIMFELRKLKFGDKPVTGDGDRRRAVERLVSRCVVRSTSRVDRSAFETGSATRTLPDDATAQEPRQRPEQVMVEVNALVERRPVSSILHSLAFRRSLENSLRGAIGALQREGGATQGGARRRAAESRVGEGAGAEETSAFQEGASRDTQRWSGVQAAQASAAPDMALLNSSPVQASGEVDAGLAAPLVLEAQPLVGPQRAREWVQQHVPAPAGAEMREDRVPTPAAPMSHFEILQEMQHEDLIMDISQLIQSHLVTSALEGDFRDVMERRLRRHLEGSGTDGRRVLQQLHQLPRNRVHRRNDFFDLGIIAGQAAAAAGSDHMDNVSVISATAAVAVPQAYTQSTAAMGREIQGLRTQMMELKNMMQLSFDLQLDIQRSIRQEVAAAMAGQAVGGSDAAHAAPPRGWATAGPPRPPPAPVSESQCLICLDRPVDTVLYQCGHMCLCHGCGMRLRHQGAHCPVCRAPIRDIIKAYRN